MRDTSLVKRRQPLVPGSPRTIGPEPLRSWRPGAPKSNLIASIRRSVVESARGGQVPPWTAKVAAAEHAGEPRRKVPHNRCTDRRMSYTSPRSTLPRRRPCPVRPREPRPGMPRPRGRYSTHSGNSRHLDNCIHKSRTDCRSDTSIPKEIRAPRSRPLLRSSTPPRSVTVQRPRYRTRMPRTS